MRKEVAERECKGNRRYILFKILINSKEWEIQIWIGWIKWRFLEFNRWSSIIKTSIKKRFSLILRSIRLITRIIYIGLILKL